MARRRPLHLRRRDVHVPADDRPAHPHRVRGGFQAGQARRRARPAHLRGGVRPPLRPRAGVVGDARPSEAPAGELSGHLEEPVEQEAGRHRPVPVRRVEDGGKGRLRRQPGLLRGEAVHRPRDHPRHPGPGDDVPRAQIRRRGHHDAHPAAIRPADRNGRVQEIVQQVQVHGVGVHVPRLPPLPPLLQGQAGPAGDRPRGGQEGADRRGPPRAWGRRRRDRTSRGPGRTTRTSGSTRTTRCGRRRCSPRRGGRRRTGCS